MVGGKGTKDNATRGNVRPAGRREIHVIIQVRRDRVTALMDDKKISEWVPSMGEITSDDSFCVDLPNLLGLGNCESLTTFEAVQVREVTGKGRSGHAHHADRRRLPPVQCRLRGRPGPGEEGGRQAPGAQPLLRRRVQT